MGRQSKRERALEYINTVIDDCNEAYSTLDNGDSLGWDADTYLSMADLLEEVKKYIVENT